VEERGKGGKEGRPTDFAALKDERKGSHACPKKKKPRLICRRGEKRE